MLETLRTSLASVFGDHRRRIIFLLIVQGVIFTGLWFVEVNYGFRGKDQIGLFRYGNDTHSYLDPIENLLDYGVYGTDPTKPFAFRMPGMLLPYGSFYVLFGREIAVHAYAIISVLMLIIGSSLVSGNLYRLYGLGPPLVFLSGFILYPQIYSYAFYGMPETLSAGLILILVYLFSEDEFRSKRLVLAGAIIAQLILLKPIFIVVTPVLGLYIFFRNYKTDQIILRALRSMFLLALIPVIVMGVWNVRNYATFNNVILLTTTLDMHGADNAFRSWCRITGQEYQAFNGKDARAWFVDPANNKYNRTFAESNPFPDFIFTDYYNIDSLRSIRADWYRLASMDESEEKARLDQQIEQRFKKISNSFQSENTFHFVVTSRLLHLKNFLFIKDSFSPFAQQGIQWTLVRGIYFLQYYYLLVLFLIGLFLAIISWHKLDAMIKLSILMTLFYILGHLIMGRIENRYIIPMLPLLCIIMSQIFIGFDLAKSRQHQVVS